MIGVPFYSIVPCCPELGTELTYFNFPTGSPILASGVYIYSGSITSINGIIFQPNKCYTITNVGIDKSPVYPLAPLTSTFANGGACESTLCAPCEVVLQCYTLYPCNEDQEVLVTNSETASLFANEFVSLFGYPGCYYVQPNTLGDCLGAENIRVNGELPCACTFNCYSITGNPTSVTYVNEDSELVTTSGSTRICSLIVPVVSGGAQGIVYNFGPCVDGVCPEVCFKFTNCITEETLIVTNTTTVLGYYSNNNVVTIQGYEGCWSIDIAEEPCDCAVNVTILQSFVDCPTCLPIVAYKFTNCNNQSIIKYSIDDYSAYVGKTVKLECGDCWFITLINFTPPATQIINIITTFESCLACNRIYYELTDCSGIASTIYTYTDLSTEVGKVIKLKDCATCWEVTLLELPTFDQSSIATTVTVVVSYDTCTECGVELGCRCSIAWPDATGLLSYIDCTGQAIIFRGLEPNTPTEKLCVRQWIIAREPIYYEDCISTTVAGCDQYIITVPPIFEPQTLYFKDCAGIVQAIPCFVSKSPIQVIICGITNQTDSDIYITGSIPVTFEVGNSCGEIPVFTCPPPVYPKRFIKPGYFTPHCDTEKYEKFACNSSEILYKTVLERRYGISNCCPDTGLGEKWLIKKELADLQGARDQNYICTPVQSCCNSTPTCGCGCNSSPKTCNS